MGVSSKFSDAFNLTNKWDPDLHILFSNCEDILLTFCPVFVRECTLKLNIIDRGINKFLVYEKCRKNARNVLFIFNLNELGKCKQLYYFVVSIFPKVVPEEIRHGPFLIGRKTCDGHLWNCEHNKFIPQINICNSTKTNCSYSS